MSELTSYYYYEDRVITPATHQYRVYHADDADKVIAEKDEEIRRQKYKRCLAMASYWLAVSYQCVDDKHRQRAEKHHRKWLDIAKRFEEAK